MSVNSPRLSWRLAELSQATGLSLPFLRKEARLGRLQTKKIGGAVIVLDSDARSYLNNSVANKERDDTEEIATIPALTSDMTGSTPDANQTVLPVTV